jgi:uncharacterized protein YdeI (YjbR/CyaY-like superfamily)
MSSVALTAWKNITPLARNECICRIKSAKKLATRKQRIARAYDDFIKGKQQPCFWAG